VRSASQFLLVVLIIACVHLTEAQQPKKIPRIGFVTMTTASAGGQNLEAFRQGLRDLGYVEGANITIEQRWAEGWAERVSDLINELIRLKVDMIVVSSATGAVAAKKATSTIPIVFTAVTDPFERGLIDSLSRPGGNVTGTSLAVGKALAANGWSCSRTLCRALRLIRSSGIRLIRSRAYS
jgi:putative tryptophan/tyrosine transport system substrate-binding protein